ncbi:MAG TPA: hypothetical protein VFV08_03125, partial [Puia sp.]|nr:hypothetical protein [Puia sp.]
DKKWHWYSSATASTAAPKPLINFIRLSRTLSGSDDYADRWKQLHDCLHRGFFFLVIFVGDNYH